MSGGHPSPRRHAAVPRGPSAHKTDSARSAKFIKRNKHLHHLLALNRSAREELLTTSEGSRQSYLLRKADEKARKIIQKNQKLSTAHQRRGRHGGKGGTCDAYAQYLEQKQLADVARREAEERQADLDYFHWLDMEASYHPDYLDYLDYLDHFYLHLDMDPDYLGAAGLSLGFVRGSKKRMLVCGVVDDAVEITANDRRGQFSVTASSNSVLHVGDAMVVFNPAMIAPLFVAAASHPLGHASTR